MTHQEELDDAENGNAAGLSAAKKKSPKVEESKSKKEHVNVVFIGHVGEYIIQIEIYKRSDSESVFVYKPLEERADVHGCRCCSVATSFVPPPQHVFFSDQNNASSASAYVH